MPENVQTRVTSFKMALAANLASKGFGEVNGAKIQRRLEEEGLWYPGKSCGAVLEGETVFNRGLNSKDSNYFVFMRDEKGGNKVSLYYYNPDSGPNAPMRERAVAGDKKSPVKPGQEYLIRKTYAGAENPAEAAEKIVEDIIYYSLLKPREEYRMESHFHLGSMADGFVGERAFTDDGVSQFSHAIRTLALYARDIVSVTSHNSFDMRKFHAMRTIAEEMGIIMVPGMELTASTLIPNGPHVCLWFGTDTAAESGARTALKGRLDYRMHPFNDGPSLFDVVPDLFEELVQKGKLLMGIAHPLNFNSSDHPLFSTGLISCIEDAKHDFVLSDIEALFRYFGATEAWNSSLPSKGRPTLQTTHVKEYAQEIVDMNLPGVALTSNSFALAFSMEMAKSGKIRNSFFGSDDHYTPQMNYVSDGLNQAEGHTVLDMSKVYARLSSKPTADQLIWWILAEEVPMRAHVFTERRDGYIHVPSGRRERNAWTAKIMAKMVEEGDDNYERAVLADIAMLAAKGKGWQIKNLEQTYNAIPWWNP